MHGLLFLFGCFGFVGLGVFGVFFFPFILIIPVFSSLVFFV